MKVRIYWLRLILKMPRISLISGMDMKSWKFVLRKWDWTVFLKCSFMIISSTLIAMLEICLFRRRRKKKNKYLWLRNVITRLRITSIMRTIKSIMRSWNNSLTVHFYNIFIHFFNWIFCIYFLVKSYENPKL